MRKPVGVLALAWFGLVNFGCATEKAVEASADLARAVGLAIIEKSHFTETAGTANATIDNPHYRVLAALVHGVLLDIGLDGVRADGSIQGQGGGADVALSPETRAALRESGLGPDAVDRLLQRLLADADAPVRPEEPVRSAEVSPVAGSLERESAVGEPAAPSQGPR